MIKSIRSKAFSTLAMPGIAAAVAAAMALAPQAAQASDGTITFHGSVLGTTCSVTGATGGNNASSFSSGSFTVTLPGVDKGSLSASGSTAGLTSFSLTLSGCPTSPAGEEVASFFSGGNINSSTGYLNNTDTSAAGATNVQIQLLNSDSTPIALNNPTAYAQGSAYVATSGLTTLTYKAQYYATAAATPGKVTTTVDYTLVYR